MKTMYLAKGYGTPSVTAMEVVREMNSTVEIEKDGRLLRVLKVREEQVIFPTWVEAHAWLTAHCESRVRAARRRLDVESSALGNVKGMKPPKD